MQAVKEIENPFSGEHFRFLLTADTTGGELFRVEVSGPPGVVSPPAHLHLRQEERFEVLEGELTLIIDSRPHLLRPGEAEVVAAGVAHTWRNSGTDTVRFVNDFRPAGAMQSFFETFCGLASEGRSDARGQPRLLQVAASSTLWDMYIAGPPILAQRLLLSLLWPLARLRGYRPRYPRFEQG